MGAAPEGENPLQLPKKLLASKFDAQCYQHLNKSFGILLDMQAGPLRLQVVVEVPKNVRPGVTKSLGICHIVFLIFSLLELVLLCSGLRLAVDVDEESELHILVPVEAAASALTRLK